MYYILTVGLIVALALGLPVGVSLGVVGLVGYVANVGSVMAWINASSIPQRMTYSLINFLLLSIPLFILAAKTMNTSGVTKRIFNFANTCVGFMPGGLGHANVVASLIFSGMSGAAVSDAAGLGQIEIEAMTSEGYDPAFSAAVTAASSTIGPIFPPSVPMVVFSTISGVSVGRLFLGGVVPGLIMTAAIMLLIIVYARKREYPRMPFPSAKALVVAFGRAFFPMLTPVILLGGIWTGMFTPTESAAVAAAYALVLSWLAFKETSFRGVFRILVETAKDTASIGFVIASAAFYGWVLARSGLTYQLVAFFAGITSDPILFLLVINVFLLIVGCFLEAIAAILIFGPVLYPAAVAVGIDPLHFGVVMVLNLMIGLLTPPFGIVVFIVQDIAKVKYQDMIRAVWPFLIPLLLVLLSLTFFPALVTWLPNTIVW